MRTHAALWKLSAPRRCLMFRSNLRRGDQEKTRRHGESSPAIQLRPLSAEVASPRPRVPASPRLLVAASLMVVSLALLTGCGVRFDMQDQPRYKAYKKSEFFSDNRASRNLPAGTVPRGFLKDNKALHTGKIDNPNANVQVQT